MQMPGFTAEAALQPRALQYGMAGAFEPPASKATVSPQACVNLGPCRVCVTIKFGIPPKACLKFSCFGFNKSFCVP